MKLALTVAFLALIGSMLLVGCRDSTPSPTSTPLPTATAQPVPSATPQSVPTQTPTPSPTPIPAPTATPVPIATPPPLYLEGWRTVPGTGAFEQTKPGLASVIISIPWVADGIDLQERASVGRLVNAAMLDGPVFLAVVDRAWVLDGLERTELTILQDLTRFRNEAVASRIAGMPFMETVEPSDSSTVDQLSSLDALKPKLLPAIAELTWVGDGITGEETQAIRRIRNFSDTNIALSVIALGWVQDGIQDLETEAIEWLDNFGGGEAVASVVGLPWVQDGIEEGKVATIEELSYVTYDDSTLASAVVALEWMQDGVDELEFEALEWIGNFSNPEVASSVVALQWAGDSVEEIEAKALEHLSYIDYDSQELALTVVGLGWVQDGITDLEFETIEWIGNFSDVTVASSVVASGWVQDGLGSEDTRAIQELSYLSNKDAAQASRIVEMPFLEFLDPADVSAIDSPSNLAWFRQDDFQRVLSHPTLSNGITDDWAKIVATLYGVSKNNPPLLDKLLDPDQVTLEERIIDLPLAGETHLAIIRTGTGAERSMDLLDHATRTIEAYMATPLPTNYVGLLFEDAVPGDSAGANFGAYVGALAKYDIDDGSSEADFAGSLIAHEVAHYYWSGNRGWVDEGIADFMGSLSENTRSGHPIEVTNSPCPYAPNILELEALDPEVGESTYTCNYALGERLFIDLYHSIGEEEFRRGLSNLYLISQTEDDGDTRENIELGIDHVKAAFTGDEGVEMPIVNTIAARWYDWSVPYAMPEDSTGLTNPILRTINGRVHTAYLSALTREHR